MICEITTLVPADELRLAVALQTVPAAGRRSLGAAVPLGPPFSDAEQAWLDALAGRLRADGFDCFVPHEQSEEMTTLTADEVYRTDAEDLRSPNALVA